MVKVIIRDIYHNQFQLLYNTATDFLLQKIFLSVKRKIKKSRIYNKIMI